MADDPQFASLVELANNFGFSFRGMLLYAQCGDEKQRQSGLVVIGDCFAFGLGLYHLDGFLSAHIVGPNGPIWPAAVGHLSRWLLRRGVARVYVRHLLNGAEKALPSDAFVDPKEHFAWCSEAPYEDETYNHRDLWLKELVSFDGDDVVIHTLNRDESKNFKNKFRSAFARFEHFLARNELQFELIPTNDAQVVEAGAGIVGRHFAHLERSVRAFGSTAMDYQQLLNHPCRHGGRYVSLVGRLVRPGGPVLPVSLFLGEQLGPECGALYCTITDRDPGVAARMFGLSDDVGYTAIGQYAYAKVFTTLLGLGWKRVDLGGSETPDLDRFKQQLGCRLVPSFWRVSTNEQLPALESFCRASPAPALSLCRFTAE